MNYQKLGKSDLVVSEIGFGCMSLPEGNDSANIVHRAIDLGINFFDTADLYKKGENEIAIGNAIKNMRNDIILATKVGNQWRSDGSGWDWNPRKDHILSSVEKSLHRLQTDYIDLYQLHGGTIDDPIDETIEAFELLKAQGKIRYYGISSIRPNVIREYVRRSTIVSVMMQYSLLDRRPEETCLDLLQKSNIGVLVRGSVAQGLLVDKPARDYLQHSKDEVNIAAESIRSYSGKHRQPAQTAIRYVLQHPAVSSVIVGIRTIQQLEEAVKTTSTPGLSNEEFAFLQNATPPNTYDQHR